MAGSILSAVGASPATVVAATGATAIDAATAVRAASLDAARLLPRLRLRQRAGYIRGRLGRVRAARRTAAELLPQAPRRAATLLLDARHR